MPLIYLDLKTLKLDNNNLTKVDNIWHLSKLEHLDLSFNQIASIEHDPSKSVPSLRILSLFSNNLTSPQNIAHIAPNLVVLSLGNNLIEDVAQLDHLVSLKKLESIRLSGNGYCAEVESYNDGKMVVLAHLTCLKHFDGNPVIPDDVEKAKDIHYLALENQKLIDTKEVETSKTKKAAEERLALQKVIPSVICYRAVKLNGLLPVTVG